MLFSRDLFHHIYYERNYFLQNNKNLFWISSLLHIFYSVVNKQNENQIMHFRIFHIVDHPTVNFYFSIFLDWLNLIFFWIFKKHIHQLQESSNKLNFKSSYFKNKVLKRKVFFTQSSAAFSCSIVSISIFFCFFIFSDI